MPTYEYECPQCGHTFEAFQNMSAKPLNKCPKCNQKLKRIIGAGSGIIFKGSGFYATDYRKKSPPSKGSGKSSDACHACPKACDRKNTAAD